MLAARNITILDSMKDAGMVTATKTSENP